MKLAYQFKITLKDIKPPVWRRILVSEKYSFWELHVAIQDAMGWHLLRSLSSFFPDDCNSIISKKRQVLLNQATAGTFPRINGKVAVYWR